MLSVEYITNYIFNSRTYILTKPDNNDVWLVDCGDIDKVLEKIGKKTIVGVLLTHTHSDHIYGLQGLLNQFPNVLIYTNTYGIKALQSPQLNMSHYHSEYPDIEFNAPNNTCVLREGDSWEVLGSLLKVYETPGHDPSCLTFIIENNAFTGDAYIPGIKVFTSFPHSKRVHAKESVERILQLTAGYHIMPGHST